MTERRERERESGRQFLSKNKNGNQGIQITTEIISIVKTILRKEELEYILTDPYENV